MKTLLLIGGSGFFGKSFLDAFHRGILNCWEIGSIIILSRSASNLRITNPYLISEAVSLLDADITNCNSLPIADYVIHAAASTDATQYLQSPELQMSNILSGTNNFCRLAPLYCQNSKLLYVSSGAVYGAHSKDLEQVSEDSALLPLALVDQSKKVYTEAKRLSEERIVSLAGTGISASIARCFAFLGYYLPRNQHFAIGNFIQNGMDARPIEVQAQHAVYRSYMHADDLVIWLMTIVAAASTKCPIFNVGSDHTIEIRDLANMIGRIYSVPVLSRDISNALQTDFYVPSITKANEELGLQLQFNLEDAIVSVTQSIKGKA